MSPWNILARWRKNRRYRIAFFAILAGTLAGSVNLMLPAEDLVINLRALVRKQAAPQDIVVIAIDDRTLTSLRARDVTRAQDARVTRRLREAGADKIYFDRNYHFDEDPETANEFVSALRQNKGKVFLAAGVSDKQTFDSPMSILPNPEFLEEAELVAVGAIHHPFGLMASVPLEWQTIAGVAPSFSASLANRPLNSAPQPRWTEMLSGLPAGYYRPDYSFDHRTIPTISYIDVLQGKFDPALVANRDIAIGGFSEILKDNYELGFQGYIPGVYIHIIAAHTFKKPLLLKLGWLPALILVSMVIVSGIGRGMSIDRYRIAGLVTVLAAGPLVLDHYGIELEIMPAALAAGIAILRARSLDKVEQASEVNLASGLPSLQLLRSSLAPQGGSLVAMKVRNYSAIVGSLGARAEAQMATEIVRRIRVAEPDVIVHHDGDRFLWFSKLTNPVDIFEHLEGLHRLVQNGLAIEEREIDISFNCGVEAESGAPVVRRIANALQAADQAVRNDELVSLFDGGQGKNQWEISLLSSLDHAINEGEVWVAYQPKADIKTGRITSAEALVRWTHPERGPISPEKFIRIAEEHHRIDRITEFVLDAAVKAVRQLRSEIPGFKISVNISAQSLRNRNLPIMIRDVLAAHNMGPDCLVLEITETDRLDRSSKTFEMMRQLVESGLALSIDDFGTGNATIDYLRLLPASEVKIDKVFVSGIVENRQDMLLVQSIIDMAHSLDRRVVAEGVETKEVMDLLESIGCDQVQGYYISRPIRLPELTELVSPTRIKETG